MKVLLLVGLLALVEASELYDSLLQRFGERQAPPTKGQEDSDEKEIDELTDRVDSLEKKVAGIEEFLKNLGFNAEESDSNGSKEEPVEQVPDSDTGDNEPSKDGASTRLLLQKIKSRMDEIKREQSQMKLSDALSRVLKEKRRK